METEDLLHELDLAGPLAPLAILQDIKDALPENDVNRRYLDGYISGRSADHHPTRMADTEFSAGWWAGTRLRGRA